jgi:hypothetical protein
LSPATGPFSAHEALDRAHLAATFFDEHVAQHPFVRANPKLRRAADRLAGQLADFYQAVGAERFRIEP